MLREFGAQFHGSVGVLCRSESKFGVARFESLGKQEQELAGEVASWIPQAQRLLSLLFHSLPSWWSLAPSTLRECSSLKRMQPSCVLCRDQKAHGTKNTSGAKSRDRHCFGELGGERGRQLDRCTCMVYVAQTVRHF